MIVVVTVERFHMSEERDETGLVRAASWWLCDAKDSYNCNEFDYHIPFRLRLRA